MKWSEVGRKVADMAPLLGAALGTPAGGAVGAVVAQVFGTKPDPDAVEEALRNDPETALKLKQIESEERVALRRITMQEAQAELEAVTRQARSVNQTMRAEYATADRFKSYWRPVFGYVMAAAFAWMFLVLGFVLAASPWRDMASTVSLVSAFTPTVISLFGIGLSVLGINIRERTKAKAIESRQPVPAGIADALAKLRS